VGFGIELGRRSVAGGVGFAVVAVAGFDEVEDIEASVGLGGEAAALEHFVFEGAHERFRPGIVVGIGTGGHALDDVCLFQDEALRTTAVLAPTVSVEDQAGCDGRE
jgi:hypothetical protein